MSQSIDLATATVALYRDGSSDGVEVAAGAPRRVDGHTVGAPAMTSNPPHDGEMHPDGDELLFLVSGSVEVMLEVDSEWQSRTLQAGEACIVPKGVWHKVAINEPSQLVHVTPGPGGEHRF